MDRLDHGEIEMGYDTKDVDLIVEEEYQRQIKHIEKTLEKDSEFKNLVLTNPELKQQYINNLVMKKSYAIHPDSSDFSGLDEYSTLTVKHTTNKASRGWSEVKSNPNHSSHYSSSVRNSRYRAMGLDENSKKDYLENLKKIKKLQKEKKKRAQILEYFGKKAELKYKEEEDRKKSEEQRKEEDRKKELIEWKEK